MSPNGRRAWRKWVLRQDLRRKHKQPKGSICRMARQARRHIPLVPGAVLPKLLTARSLVGMSMGARKRIAWREYLAWCRKNPDRELLKSATIDTWDEKGLEEGYQRGLQAQREVRTKHRIGERLRPCPGCWHCQTTWQQSSIYPQTAVMHRRGCSHDDPSGFCCFGETISVTMECDGSGVLPARRS